MRVSNVLDWCWGTLVGLSVLCVTLALLELLSIPIAVGWLCLMALVGILMLVADTFSSVAEERNATKTQDSSTLPTKPGTNSQNLNSD